ncbi:MAG TPA: phosphate ABC transporter permease subunit PstC [Gammaproteobacteria bacterium]|nr:phosphate ABC transporter permease subunit PstC [Gammaproteobacteria bacterium]
MATSQSEIPDSVLRRQRLLDRTFQATTTVAAGIVLILLAGIIISLFVGGWQALSTFGFGFIVTDSWNPVTEQFGALVPIYGTLVSSLIALLIAVPISFGIAIFLTEVSPHWLRRPIGTAIELLAAIPSIIYGMWGLFLFAPVLANHVQPWLQSTFGNTPFIGILFQGAPLGIGMLPAGIILGIMIIPFITAIMRDVFVTTPKFLKESAYGLGATTWEVVWNVVLPYTRVGAVGGIFLGLGRALGETMAVTFIIGNTHRLSVSLFEPGNSIASTLANEFTEAVGETHTSSLIALGLVLFMITFIVLTLAKLLLMSLNQRSGKKS